MNPEEDVREFYLAYLRSKEQELLGKLARKHVKTQKKIFHSEHGTFKYNFIYVKNGQGKLFSPLREYLGIGKFMNMSPEFKAKIVMKSTRASYQKCAEDTLDSFNVSRSKKTIQRYVVASNFPRVVEKPLPRQKILLCDSTKARNWHLGHHNMTALVSLDAETNYTSLAASGVNVSIPSLISNLDLSHYAAFVGDGDLAFRPIYANGLPFHLCHLHAIRDTAFYLWDEGMPKEKRKQYVKCFESILYALQGSTMKYWQDYDDKRLTARIDKTRVAIANIALELEKEGMTDAPRYLREHQEHLLTASLLAMKGIRVPFTTNHIEKVMQELGVRTKKKGMNWSEKGLAAITHLTLARYFAPQKRRNYKLALCSNMQVVGT